MAYCEDYLENLEFHSKEKDNVTFITVTKSNLKSSLRTSVKFLCNIFAIFEFYMTVKVRDYFFKLQENNKQLY